MIVLDASVLIAHLDPDDAHHSSATLLLREPPAAPLLVHGLTLAEVLVGGVRVGRGEAMLAQLYAAGLVLAPQDEHEPLRLAELRVSSGLKLPDCCVLDAALQHGAALATFDAALAEAGQRGGLDVLPQHA